MAKIISMINLKGGVGKTTSSVQIAECLVSEFNKRVLVIDLDPQTNASIALIGEDRWDQLDRHGKTLFHLFNDKIEQTKKFNLAAAIEENASNLDLPGLHLLASSIRFIDIQDRMHEIADRTQYTVNPIEVLKHEITPIKMNYDYIIIDCPPNLGFITKNGIEVSDYFLIPTIPDKLSTYGIPQIIQQIDQLKTARNLPIKCLGLLITKYNTRTKTHISGAKDLPTTFEINLAKSSLGPTRVFKSIIPFAQATANAVDFEADKLPQNFRVKHGNTESNGKLIYKHIIEATEEFILYAK